MMGLPQAVFLNTNKESPEKTACPADFRGFFLAVFCFSAGGAVLSFPQFLAVLGAELVGAGAAGEGRVGLLPEPLRVHHHAKFPHQPGGEGQRHQAEGIEAPGKNQGRKHHQVVPVEDAAGGAAAVFHDKPEGAPDQHTDQITDIEHHRDHKKAGPVQPAGKIQAADGGDKQAPEQEHLVGRLGGGNDILAQGLIVDFFPDGPEAVGKKFLGAQGHLVPDGHDLQKHIGYPNRPQQVQGGGEAEKVHPLQYGKSPPAEAV